MTLSQRPYPAVLVLAMVAIFTTLLPTPASAQTSVADTTFLKRNIRQQTFLQGYFKENKPEHPPKLPEEVDSYFTAAAAAWAAEVEAEPPLVGQLNPYVVMWLLVMAYGGSEMPQETECYTYAAYAVPAFLADFEQYSTVDPAHAPLIFWGYDWIGGSLALGCDLEARRWNPLQRAFARAPSLYQKYLDAEAYSEERFARQIRQAKRFFERNAPLYRIRDALYQDNLDEAFAGLAAATAQGHKALYLRPLGEALWKAYAKAAKTDYALATLDLLSRTLTAGDLPRDTLRTWYAAVEPARGPRRFALMNASAPPTLIPSEEQADLTGVYTDLLTNTPVDLADLEGRLVFLDFWTTWCSPCIAEIPKLRALAAAYGDRVAFVSVNADAISGGEGPDGVRAFMDKHSVDYPVLYDEPDRSLAAQFGVAGYPMKFLISPEGMLLVHPTDGRHTVNLAEVDAYLEGLR